MAYERVPLEDFAKVFGSTSTELSSAALGAKVLSVSDEFFAEASNLLKVAPSASLKGQFGPRGSLFDGWETRRHNPTYDWCIIKLGAQGRIAGFDIDTAHFSGNEAPAASVQALYVSSEEGGAEPSEVDASWTEILPRVDLGPSARHLFRIPLTTQTYTHVKLNQYPDGGIARFRVYGQVVPRWPADAGSPVDLAFVLNGGRVVYTSDAHFSSASNILLPGRGTDMRDGWETRRSRTPGHKVWTIIKLGAPGYIQSAELDTAFFLGNFPESASLSATSSPLDVPPAESEWTEVLPKTKMGPGRNHVFPLGEAVAGRGRVWTHVRVTMYPDGGMKRVRIIGTRAPPPSAPPFPAAAGPLAPTPARARRPIPALPLTPAAFAPFGHVIQAWSDPTHAPPGTQHTLANHGTAIKYHRLAPVVSSYPATSGARTAVSVFRSTPAQGAVRGAEWEVRVMERHGYTNQVFVPMGRGALHGRGGEEGLPENRLYLVIVAQNGKDDRPDMGTVRAFVACTAQGIAYHTGIWHHPMITMESTIDFACVETQIGSGSGEGEGERMDCEVVSDVGEEEVVVVQIPEM